MRHSLGVQVSERGETEELVRRAHQGDVGAYDELFDHVGDRVLVFIRCRLGGWLAEQLEPLDVLQETYLEAHRSFASFELVSEGAFTRWLFGVAENRLKTLAKRHGALKRRPPARLVQESTALRRIRDEGSSPSAALGRRESCDQLVAAMHELPAEEREALLLRYFQGWTLDAIGERMDRSQSAVRRLLGRALERVGGRLETP